MGLAAADGVAAADSPVSVSSVSASFFGNPSDSGSFNAGPATAVRFTQEFPVINFNAPGDLVACKPASNISPSTVPFTDVVLQPDGSCKTVQAAGNNQQAAAGDLASFQAVFTGSFQVNAAGRVTFNFYSDDGWILSIGPGANNAGQPTHVSGQMLNAPPVGVFSGFTVVGSYNVESLPTQNNLVVAFPAAGTYPFEIDYTNCCGTTQTLTVLANGAPIPPTSALTLDVKGIAEGDQVQQGRKHIDVAATSGQAQKVELLVDGQSRGVSSAPPFGFDWDTSAESAGPHTVVIRGTDTSGGVSDKQLTLQVLGPAVAAAVSPVAAATSPAATPTPLPAASISVTSGPPVGLNTILIGVGSLLVLLALIGVGLYYFLVYRKTQRPRPAPVVAAPVAVPVASDNTEFIGRVPASDLTMVGNRRPQVQLPTARLLVKPDREIQLSRSTETVIGRDSSNNGFVDDRQVSRHHARISCVDGDFWIEDLNSLNGTRVNGSAISSRQKLVDKDQINVGDTILTFAIESN
jgi:hypothetical protein